MTPRCSPSGPVSAKAMIVGEAPGEEEDGRTPFLGTSGQELTRILDEANLDRSSLRLTNVFMSRPPGNKLDLEWCVSKAQAAKAYLEHRDTLIETTQEAEPHEWPTTYTWPPISQGAYLKPQYLSEIYRLRDEILETKPNLVIACGGKATWALLRTSKITKIRGAVAYSTLIPNLKILPAFHPAYVMRNWNVRTLLVADMIKAKEQLEFPEIRRPEREIWINPNHYDLIRFQKLYLDGAKIIAFDVETARQQVTEISFSPNPQVAIVVPFVDKSKPDYSHWETHDDELKAWKWVRGILANQSIKLAQNGLYDIQYLWRQHGIPVNNFSADTMLLHHSLFIELPKDLGFLGSIYTDEVAWKLMRHRARDEVDKKDD